MSSLKEKQYKHFTKEIEKNALERLLKINNYKIYNGESKLNEKIEKKIIENSKISEKMIEMDEIYSSYIGQKKKLLNHLCNQKT